MNDRNIYMNEPVTKVEFKIINHKNKTLCGKYLVLTITSKNLQYKLAIVGSDGWGFPANPPVSAVANLMQCAARHILSGEIPVVVKSKKKGN